MEGKGVKDLIDEGLDCVPKKFKIHPWRTTWGLSTWNEVQSKGVDGDLPVVDLSQNKELILESLRSACETWGFFQLIGHGVPLGLMEHMVQLGHDFFNQPSLEKSRYYSEDITKPFRWASGQNYATNKVALWIDYIYMSCIPLPSNDQLPVCFKDTLKDYSDQMNELATKILGLLSESLGLEPTALAGVIAHPSRRQHVMKLNYYPVCPNPELAIGAAPHTDVNSFTFLQQQNGVDGYEALHEGRWISVKPIEGAFLFNVGDQLEIASNGRFKSVVHRAVVGLEPRVSVGSFFAPSDDDWVAPLPELVKEGQAPLLVKSKYKNYFERYFHRVFTNTETMLGTLYCQS